MSAGERLVLNEIVVSNFKSFAGRVRIGPFHHHFTAIVGANGSGKSNIIDALCFVFGRRANQLRQKKLQSLIHKSAGTTAQQARVDVNLGILVDPDKNIRTSSFTISREIFTQGSSKYYIDDRHVTQQEIAALMKSHGIDLDQNRFLILQGEVEKMASLPSKSSDSNEEGLLELCEGLIGTNVYIETLCRLERDIQDLQENLSESDTILQRKRAELKSLSVPLGDALKYIRGHKYLIIARARLLIKQYADLVAEITGKETDLTGMRMEENKLVERALEIDSLVATLSAKIADQERQSLEIQDQRRKLNSDLEKCEFNITRLNKQREGLVVQHAAESENMRKNEDEAQRLMNESDNILKRLEDGISKKPSISSQLVDVKEVIAKFDEANADRIVELSKESTILREEKIELDALHDKHAGIISHYKTQKALIIGQREKSGNEIKLLKDQVQSIRKTIARKADEMEDLSSQRTNYEQQLTQIEHKWTTLSSQRADHQARADQLQAALRVGGASRSTIRSRELYKALSQEFNSGTSSLHNLGVWLLDELEVDVETYGHACTCAGLHEELVITEDDQSAEAIVSYVRDRRLGKVTCLVRAKVSEKGQQLKNHYLRELQNGTYKFLEGRGEFLFNIVKPKHKIFEPIIYYKLGLTILSKGGLQVAKELSFGQKTRYKVVTFEGEVIDKNGSMTGGQSTNYLASRSIPLPAEASSIPTKRQELEIADKTCSQLSRSIIETERQMCYIKETCIPRILGDMERKISEGKDLESRLSELKSRLKARIADPTAVEDAIDADEKLKGVESSMVDELTSFAPTMKRRSAVEARLSEISKAIRTIGGLARNELTTKEARLQSQIVEIERLERDGVFEAESARKKSERLLTVQVQEIRQRSEDIEKRIEGIENAIEEMTNKKVELTEQLSNLPSTAANTDEIIALKEKRSDAQTEKRTNTTLCSQLSAAITKVDEEYCKLGLKRDAVIKKIEDLREEFESFPVFDLPVEPSSPPRRASITPRPVISTIAVVSDEPLAAEMHLAFPDYDELSPYAILSVSELQLQLRAAETVTESTKTINLNIISEYQGKRAEVTDAECNYNRCRDHVTDSVKRQEELKQQRLYEFEAGFSIIAQKTKELYQMLTRGGDADLEYRDADPFKDGIAFTVRPPGKSWRPLQNLSGGEKTLSSLALIFALHHYSPTPFYCLDEIDAALDTSNVILIATYVANMQARQSQFVVISLRHEFFQRCDRLLGVIKTDNKARVYLIDPDDLCIAEDVEQRQTNSNHGSSKHVSLEPSQ